MDISNPNLSEPLKPAVLHILLALSGGDSHGYAVMQAVREQSGGRVPLQTGSFYRHLAFLIRQGWVKETPPPRDDDPRRGTYYRITSSGRAALAEERERVLALAAVMKKLRPAGKGTL
jgi:DNA-binding PadR family transcriptional regulator